MLPAAQAPLKTGRWLQAVGPAPAQRARCHRERACGVRLSLRVPLRQVDVVYASFGEIDGACE